MNRKAIGDLAAQKGRMPACVLATCATSSLEDCRQPETFFWDTDVGFNPTLGWKFMDNIQVRLLGGALDVPPGQATRDHLETAKRRLAKFQVVAKLEDLADPTKRWPIFRRMGWNIDFEEDQCNAARRPDPLPHADKVWLTELNKYDYELYNSIGAGWR